MYRSRLWIVLLTVALGGCPSPTPPQPQGSGDASVPQAPSVIATDAPAPGTVQAPPVAKAVTGNGDAAPLVVASHIPKKRLGPYARPAVVFNKPVQAFGVEPTGPQPAEISPWIPGRWKWLGSSVLEFDSRERLPLSTEYWVQINAGMTAIDGGVLAEPYSFTFETQRVAAIGGSPVNRWNRFLHAVPEQVFKVRFNQPVVAESVESAVYVKGGGALVPLTLKALDPMGKPDPKTGLRRDLRMVATLVPKTPLKLATQ